MYWATFLTVACQESKNAGKDECRTREVVKYLTPDGEVRTTLDREVIRQLHRFESRDSPSIIVGPIVVA